MLPRKFTYIQCRWHTMAVHWFSQLLWNIHRKDRGVHDRSVGNWLNLWCQIKIDNITNPFFYECLEKYSSNAQTNASFINVPDTLEQLSSRWFGNWFIIVTPIYVTVKLETKKSQWFALLDVSIKLDVWRQNCLSMMTS